MKAKQEGQRIQMSQGLDVCPWVHTGWGTSVSISSVLNLQKSMLLVSWESGHGALHHGVKYNLELQGGNGWKGIQEVT